MAFVPEYINIETIKKEIDSFIAATYRIVAYGNGAKKGSKYSKHEFVGYVHIVDGHYVRVWFQTGEPRNVYHSLEEVVEGLKEEFKVEVRIIK